MLNIFFLCLAFSRRRVLVAALASHIAFPVFPAWSQTSPNAGGSAITLADSAKALLDGLRFRAGIVRRDAGADVQSQPLEDRLVFSNGAFSSAVCKKYNFAEAPYWTRKDGDAIHFLAELTSPTDGTMVWKGTIRGDRLEGTMRWTKKRWYWTVDTEHNIVGAVEKGPEPTSSPEK